MSTSSSTGDCMLLAVGARFGPYEIVARIGAGGMGEVYRARDTRLGRDVAIKVLPAGVADDVDRRARFEHEARAAATLSHPNILALYDVGRENGISFLVTELLEGRTLRELMEDERLTPPRATALAAQIVDGLAAAHLAGIDAGRHDRATGGSGARRGRGIGVRHSGSR